MKDIGVKTIPSETIYKDVVIIGNGPSGISLSYMLAGNWPYWNQEKMQMHPDEMLRARLNYADPSISLVEQDLLTLADGLDGRSTNPVSLLLDSLEHPCADLGMELPSMLEYRFDATKQIDHVVLGKGPPGGSWHKMDPNLRTLSLAGWMSLPGLTYGKWEAMQKEKETIQKSIDITSCKNGLTSSDTSCPDCIKLRSSIDSNTVGEIFNNNNEFEPESLCCKCTKKHFSSIDDSTVGNSIETALINNTGTVYNSPPRRNLSLKRMVSKEVQTRALVSRVAQYYEDYVHYMKLDEFFVNNTYVTFIAPVSESCPRLERFQNARWIVTGVNEVTRHTFFYACKNLVLANGVSDLPNRLGIRNELYGTNRYWVKHELRGLETALENLSDNERQKLKPVLLVGAGLSAADAVSICRSSDIDVIHVYRSKSVGLDKSLPENVYPEYHEVHKMMRDPSKTYAHYTPIPEHTISNLYTDNLGCHYVTVRNLKTSETKTFAVSYCAILIGARPNLRFIAAVNRSQSKLKLANKSQCLLAEPYSSQVTKKLTWLKTLCEKCKHFNFCDWNRRLSPVEFHHRIFEYPPNKIYECNKSCNNDDWNSCPADDSGIGLGVDPMKPIDSKTNQIDVNKYTNEVQGMPKGVFAVGPLVGDNFVRFIPGGALAVTSALHQEND